MAIKAKKLTIGLPFGLGQLELEANEVEQRAVWSLYVQLMTRVATQPFDLNSGSLRNVLSSLYKIFSVTREILTSAGPGVAHGPNSFGPIALEILTKGLAPFTTKWHQPLLDYEQVRPQGVSPLEHERIWGSYKEMKEELAVLQEQMLIYAQVLAKISGAEEP